MEFRFEKGKASALKNTCPRLKWEHSCATTSLVTFQRSPTHKKSSQAFGKSFYWDIIDMH